MSTNANQSKSKEASVDNYPKDCLSKPEPYKILGEEAKALDNRLLRNKNFTYVPTVVYYGDVKSDMIHFTDPNKINLISGGDSRKGGAPGTLLTYILTSTEDIPKHHNDYFIMQPDINNFEILNNLRLSGVHVPRYQHPAYTYGGNNCMTEEDVYVLKRNNTGRSLGNVIVDRKKYIKMEQWVGQNYKENNSIETGLAFNKMFYINPDHTCNDSEAIRLYSSLVQRNFIIQDYVDIKNEYKLYYVDTPNDRKWDLMYHSATEIEGSQEPDTYVVDLINLDNNLFKTIENYVQNHNAPCMCFDVYEDTDDNWGVFECSPSWHYNTDDMVEMMGDRLTDAYLHHIHHANPMVMKVTNALCQLDSK